MNDDTNNTPNRNAAEDANKLEPSKAPVYRILGESGLVEDEEGNIYSASEIEDDSDVEMPTKTALYTSFTKSSFVSELDDKANPAYWYYYYDPRYCGPSREAYMEKMAQRYRHPERQSQEEKKADSPVMAESAAEETVAAESVTVEPEEEEPTVVKPAAEEPATAEPPVVEPIEEVPIVVEPTEEESSVEESTVVKSLLEEEEARKRADRHQREAEREGLRPDYHYYSTALPSCGLVNRRNEVLISYDEYRNIGLFHNGLARVQNKKTGKFGFIDIHGKEVIPCTWRSTGEFSEYMAGVQDDQKRCGYIDVTGRLVIPCAWKECWPFSEGLAIVQDFNDRLGFIDTSGELVIPCRWKQVESFKNGRSRVSETRHRFRKDKWVYIDKQGRVIED